MPRTDLKLMHAGRYVRPWTVKALPDDLGRFVTSYRASLDVIEALPAQMKAIEGDPDLSARGKATRRRALAEQHAAVLQTARADLAHGLAEIDRMRAAMVRSAVDKNDVAAAMVRGEIRQWLRALPDAKRAGILSVDTDPQIAAAVIEAPAELSGATPHRQQALQEAAIRHLNPEAFERVETLAECVAALSSAAGVAAKAITQTAGITTHELDEMLGIPSLADRVRERLRADGFDEDGESDAPETQPAAA